MILTPDDHRSLQALDGKLAACEPHLAAMFTIFSRLNAEEAPPPSEDLIVAALPAAPVPAENVKQKRRGGGRRRARTARARTARARLAARPRDRGWKPVAAIAIPVLLLVTVIMVMFFGLSSAIKCSPQTTAARTGSSSTALTVPGGASLAGCQQSAGTAKSAG
jgi:hypothetical protein